MLLHVSNPNERDRIANEAKNNRFKVKLHPQNPHSMLVYSNSRSNKPWLKKLQETNLNVSLLSHGLKQQKNVLIPKFQLLANDNNRNAVISGSRDIQSPKVTKSGDKAMSFDPNAESKRVTLPNGTFLPTDLFNIYNYPTPSTTRANVAIIELGGGYKQNDLTYYWTKVLNYPANSVPNVYSVSIDKARNRPGVDADFEVVLDIEVVGGMFPNGKVNIYVYFAPNTLQGFYHAFQSAIFNTSTRFSAISVSWGAPEAYWGGSANMNAFNQLFAQAVNRGITIFCASGDHGSNDGVSPANSLNVDFPASGSNVISCGGTTLVCPSQIYSNITTRETVWSGSGGGFSSVFTPQSFQNAALRAGSFSLTKRASPDVCGVANPNTGWAIYLRSRLYIIGGTSAVSPMWSALWSNIMTGRTRQFAGPKIYPRLGTTTFHDILTGNNNIVGNPTLYSAKIGYDLCTGLGSPHGQNLKAIV